MVFHPLETLKSLGVTDIMIVTGGNSIGDFMQLLGSGENFGVRFTYKIQDRPMGIAHALLLAEDFAKGEKLVVILGDNVFDNSSIPHLDNAGDDKAVIFLKEVEDPERFGVATVDGAGNVLGIEEKPGQPKSNYAVTGMYVYPPDVYDFIRTLKPSGRGELEITDVNNFYVQNNRIRAVKLDGFWSDAGTFPSLMRASNFLWKKADEEANIS